MSTTFVERSINSALVPANHYQNTRVQGYSQSLETLPFRGSVTRLSKVKQIMKQVVPVVIGAIALEIVITFSFRSSDGLYLVLSTLGLGTSVYVFDGIKR